MANSGRPWYEDYYKSCDQCSVASIPNIVYLPNGSTVRGTSHHRIFHIGNVRSGKDIKLYGIVDGFTDGQSVADFVADHLVNEILPLGHESHIMNEAPTDSDIKTLLRQTFKRVDNLYFSDCIGETLARRCAQQMGSFDQTNMDAMNAQISGFATALIALIYNNKLFIANLGDSRALLIKRVNSEWKVVKICDWHHPSDPDEACRLADLEIDSDDVEPPTRCFGDFFRKWGYKEVPSLCKALGEPITADASIHGPYSASF
uniref:PPM-type phosphatase domain-containing protein n=1 Tax=Syphacia muris TaxID=451379 RepID=A0A0N5AM49_9BILA